MSISRPARITLIVFCAAFGTLAIITAIAIQRFEPTARQYALSVLRDRYQSDVEMGDLQIALFPVVHATGENLVFRFKGRRDLPPMISIRRFTIEARLIGFFRNPRRIRLLRLEGLHIRIPPQESSASTAGGGQNRIPLIFEQIIANGADVQMLPRGPSKEPLDFDIRELTLHHVGVGMPMTFHAKLTNPKPPGLIHSDGRFGPWNREDPSQTPVSGAYTFADADLGIFHGIAGTLKSSGKYHGQLDRIEVEGTADVPNFALTSARKAMPLHTTFKATVDGTNGNTVLHPVQAVLGKSHFSVSGAIERHALQEHKTIQLDAGGSSDRIQDFLRLAIRGQPPMTGRLGFRSKVRIPPGDTDVMARLQLDGTFEMREVHFESRDVDQKLANLSNHALGKPKAPDIEPVYADLVGRFHLRGGILTLPAFQFEIPGALIRLHGTYTLASGEIDMQGQAKLRATVSEMTTGVKHVLLMPLDPFFRRQGAGTLLPIKIGGTRGQPSFKLDIGRLIKHG